MVKTKWLASLSDGTTVIEGKAPFAEVEGELSPWNKLLKHLEENDLHITGLRIQVKRNNESIKTYNLPSFNCNRNGSHEKWNDITPMPPVRYDYHRRIRRSLTTSEIKKYIEIEAIYPDFSVSLLST